MEQKQNLLEVKQLSTTFQIQKNLVKAVRGIDIQVKKGEILSVVGESGSGKSVLMKSIMGILPENANIVAKSITFEHMDMQQLSKEQQRQMRGKEIAMIFQDPMTALNPLKTIGQHLCEVLMRHQKMKKTEAIQEAIEALKKVGIPAPEKRLKQYPHEFSGGMRQRVLIAMALCCHPKLLIADEPTTALDVTIQAQILELLKELQEKEQMSVVLITHDLGVVASLSERIVVMYGGLVMEEGLTDEIFYHPTHPYTQALLQAIPKPVTGNKERLEAIPGMAPSLINPPAGCPFAERCRFVTERCKEALPTYQTYSSTQRAMCISTREELEQRREEGC